MPHEIVAVMPPSFEILTTRADAWAPLPADRVADGSNIPSMMVAVRTSGDPLAVAAAVRDAVWSVDRGVPIAELQTMRALVGATLGRPRLLVTLLAAFAATGLALGAVGVYGIVAFGVTRRRREIGIRMALGADRRSVVRLMLRRVRRLRRRGNRGRHRARTWHPAGC